MAIYVLENGRLFDGFSRDPIEPCYVAVEGGEIREVGTRPISSSQAVRINCHGADADARADRCAHSRVPRDVRHGRPRSHAAVPPEPICSSCAVRFDVILRGSKALAVRLAVLVWTMAKDILKRVSSTILLTPSALAIGSRIEWRPEQPWSDRPAARTRRQHRSTVNGLVDLAVTSCLRRGRLPTPASRLPTSVVGDARLSQAAAQ